ncbi:hypothetical protein B566_EDAN015133 [Ephemera danica]|nr:hypothetical protein B566_EDAN015133 [Ephemera danica]
MSASDMIVSSLALCLLFSVVSGGLLPQRPPLVSYDAMSRIVGGQPASEGEYPSQVSIRYAGAHNCGGTIISDRFILTAAHCVKIPGVEQFTVAVGTNNWNKGVEHNITTATPHAGFNWTDFSSPDIGLIEVDPPIEFNNVTQPAIMAEPFEETFAGSPAIIVGWGLRSGDSGGPLYVDGQIIHGITSWSSNGCAAQGYPGVFTRVASYRDWIYAIAGV